MQLANKLSRWLNSHLDPPPSPSVTSRAREAFQQNDLYDEEDPAVWTEIKGLVPSKADGFHYVRSLFPFLGWMRRYNLRWFLGDILAGLTVGIVVVPQAMAYALLAQLSPEYGLYTSFAGAAVYWLVGTSKDVVVGTTAVGSLLLGSIVTEIERQHPGEYTPEQVALVVSLLSGFILLFVGLARLGWIVDLIPYISISAFVTAAGINIIATQLPVLLGIAGIDTRGEIFRILLDTLRGLPRTKMDAAIGILSLALLALLKEAFHFLETRPGSRARLWGIMSSIRFAATIVVFTLIAWLVNRHADPEDYKFRLVGTISRGFNRAGVPTFDTSTVGLVAGELPAMIIILVIEHIAIAKSFGKQFGYRVDASQEILAQGLANVFGPFLGGYVCTGSFGASAVLSKAGVRTPLGVAFSAIILVVVLYGLTGVLYWIPRASLAALIIHAVVGLITGPATLYKYWTYSPIELATWVCGLVVALFVSLEVSIYVTIAISAAVFLVRTARLSGSFVGRVRARMISWPPGEYRCSPSIIGGDEATLVLASDDDDVSEALQDRTSGCERDVAVLYSREDGSDPAIDVAGYFPGVFVYRFQQPLAYMNQAQLMEAIYSHIRASTSRATDVDADARPSDRLWVDPAPDEEEKAQHPGSQTKPRLRAVVLDFSAVMSLDITIVQGLIDLRDTLAKHAAPGAVEWHFCNVQGRWLRRTLVRAGFGYPAGEGVRLGHTAYASVCSGPEGKPRPLTGVSRPFLHQDLAQAVAVAVHGAKSRLTTAGFEQV